MKKRNCVLIIIISSLLVGSLSFFLGINLGFNTTIEDPKLSPTRNFEVETLFGREIYGDYVMPYIVSNNGTGDRYLIDKKFFINSSKVIIDWGGNDTLWVYSSDIGVYCWEFINGVWEEIPEKDMDYSIAPEKIKEEVSRLIKQK